MSSSSIPVSTHGSRLFHSDLPMDRTAGSAVIVLIGRILFSAIFIISSFGDFTRKVIDYAAQSGVPAASVLVPLAGILALLSGLSVLFGFYARIGAWGIVLFLVVITPVMHNFWAATDPAFAQEQFFNFMKNIAMLGAALMITQFGAGPFSIDAKRR